MGESLHRACHTVGNRVAKLLIRGMSTPPFKKVATILQSGS